MPIVRKFHSSKKSSRIGSANLFRFFLERERPISTAFPLEQEKNAYCNPIKSVKWKANQKVGPYAVQATRGRGVRAVDLCRA
jgi:hypothetical protein